MSQLPTKKLQQESSSTDQPSLSETLSISSALPAEENTLSFPTQDVPLFDTGEYLVITFF